MLYSEQGLRNGFNRAIDLLEINKRIVLKKCSDELILAFDPTFISKSGKHTDGLCYYWSGKDQRMKKGLELGCLAAIDIKNQTGFHLDGIQTPDSKERKKKKISLVDHYRDFLLSRTESLKEISHYIAVDGYFMKKEFILPLVKEGLHVITKMRLDANLKYIYNGNQKNGRGRKRKHSGKVNLKKLERDKWTTLFSTKNQVAYTAIVYCVMLKMNVRIVYYLDKRTMNHQVFLCTDIKMNGKKMLEYYRMRFQIEFLIRDAKQFSGLEDCQARSRRKLNFHFNLSLTNVNLAKAQHYLSIPKGERESFSLQDIKRQQHNKLMVNFIFSNLGLELNSKKIKNIYEQCTNFGRMAA